MMNATKILLTLFLNKYFNRRHKRRQMALCDNDEGGAILISCLLDGRYCHAFYKSYGRKTKKRHHGKRYFIIIMIKRFIRLWVFFGVSILYMYVCDCHVRASLIIKKENFLETKAITLAVTHLK